MSAKPLSEKLYITSSTKGIVINASIHALPDMQLPDSFYKEKLSGVYDYIHLFIINKDRLEKQIQILKKHLKNNGTLWVSWPKGGKLSTDLNIKEVIRIAYDLEMVESTCLSVDDTWSAIKLTFPKPGKEYHNSYGKHPDRNKLL